MSVPQPRLLPETLWGPIASLLALLAVAVVLSASRSLATITDLHLIEQDLVPTLLVVVALLALTACLGPRATPLPAWATDHRLLVGAAALATFAVSWSGAKLVFQSTPVSADEAMARFDAAVFADGRLFAPLAPEWRELQAALAPNYLMPFAGGDAWISAYLPGNAAIQAVFMKLGDADLANAVLAAIAVVAGYACARRLWPEHPGRAVVVTALLATAPQFLIMAMTPYAMTAHLAANLVWLWLVLDPSRRSQALAAGVAVVGVGLHQVVFHPMFAAPIVVWLWTSGRRGAAAFHAAVYAAAAALWSTWFLTTSRLYGLEPAPGNGSALFTLLDLLRNPNLDGPGLMIQNLVRFASWQSPLLWPLWLVGAGLALRRRPGGPAFDLERTLVLIPVATLLVLLATMPFQGHGWGYRYLHGALAAMLLTAALGWSATLDRLATAGRRAAWTGFVAAAIASVTVLLPVRLHQAWAWTRPIVLALDDIRGRDAGAILIEPGLFYGVDLARNDPFLRERPLILAMEPLSPGALAQLCLRGTVSVFTLADGRRAGLRTVAPPAEHRAHLAALRNTLASPACRAAATPPRRTPRPGAPGRTTP